VDEIDRSIINRLQGGFPVVERPFQDAARPLGISEDELIARIARLLEQGTLSRFGPLFNIERAGGAFTLAAMSVPPSDFERVAELVGGIPEVAHNYQRDHALNMWFVLATETRDGVARALARIEDQTGYRVLEMPKLEEYFVGMQVIA
jgi:DNA-binding Lrp family transcriptional regulator